MPLFSDRLYTCLLYTSSQVPVVAPLANVAAAPLFPVVCAGGFAAVLASLAVPAVAPALIGFASMGTGALTAVVRALASVPYASLPASVPLSLIHI